MGYKWKPSKTARREFAQKMANDSQFAADYYAKKEEKSAKKRNTSKFDYNMAGGEYIPTQYQSERALTFIRSIELTSEQRQACEMVNYGYSCKEKVHHDNIHIVNELIRANAL